MLGLTIHEVREAFIRIVSQVPNVLADGEDPIWQLLALMIGPIIRHVLDKMLPKYIEDKKK